MKPLRLIRSEAFATGLDMVGLGNRIRQERLERKLSRGQFSEGGTHGESPGSRDGTAEPDRHLREHTGGRSPRGASGRDVRLARRGYLEIPEEAL